MSNNVLFDITARLQKGLNRSAIQSCSRWAEEYRVMPNGKFTFDDHPWCRDMHDAQGCNVGMKAAQMGYTETMLNIAFYAIDILKQNVLYVLPNKTPDAADFSTSRFDAALSLSPHLSKLFTDVKNVGHKQAGSANLFIRGSQSRTGLKSIPVSKIILDELEEMNQDNIPLAFERSSGQDQADRLLWLLSTPTIDGRGIKLYFDQSTQDTFQFLCPHCSKRTVLRYPDCFVICGDSEDDPRVGESYIRCLECKHPLAHDDKADWLSTGIWVPTVTNREYRGFHISQLYSTKESPRALAVAYHRGLKNPAHKQEFFNSKLGLTHEDEGSKVTEANLQACMGSYEKYPSYDRGLVTMGIDVGLPDLHVEVTEYLRDKNAQDVNVAHKARVLFEGTIRDFEQIDDLILKYHVLACVIDANPERRKVDELISRRWGKVFACFYTRSNRDKTITFDSSTCTVSVDRSSWLDCSLARFRNGTITLPLNTSKQYKEHVKNLVRIYEFDKNGNPVPVYVNKGPDHFGHARNYCEMALNIGLSFAKNYNISEKIL